MPYRLGPKGPHSGESKCNQLSRGCEANSITLENCPTYIREWIKENDREVRATERSKELSGNTSWAAKVSAINHSARFEIEDAASPTIAFDNNSELRSRDLTKIIRNSAALQLYFAWCASSRKRALSMNSSFVISPFLFSRCSSPGGELLHGAYCAALCCRSSIGLDSSGRRITKRAPLAGSVQMSPP
jgi:hypothetical protein